MSEQLTNGEIAVLNAAREILHAHTDGFPDDYGQARMIVFAEQADDAIFEYLNNANTWGKVPMTHEQVHGYAAPTPELEPEPEPEPEPAPEPEPEPVESLSDSFYEYPKSVSELRQRLGFEGAS